EDKAARLRAAPKQAPKWHRNQALEAEDAGQWFAVEFHRRRLIELEPDKPEHHQNLGVALAVLGRWQAAAEEFAREADWDRDNAGPLANQALALLAHGDEKRYRQVRADMLARFHDTDNARNANAVAYTAALLPVTEIEAEQLVALARRAVK